MTEHVVLVDEKDHEIGTMEKMEAHRKALLHRAFSVFVMNDNDEVMMQRRALHKYHSGGLWTNTCCSHPRPGEGLKEAVHRRLKEEMGIDCRVEKLFHFTYKADVGQGLTEHEFDHVFIGYYNEEPYINLEEASGWKWMTIHSIQNDLKNHPEHYTQWFRIVFDRFSKNYKERV